MTIRSPAASRVALRPIVAKNPAALEQTSGLDSLGRAHFTIYRHDTDGIFRPQLSQWDGKPVGRRRAQCFFAKPEQYLHGKCVQVDDEAAA